MVFALLHTTQVVAPVTLSTAGSYSIYAQNGSGGGLSNSLTLVIGTPVPSLTALVTSPSSPTAGQQFTIDISGNNFDPNSVQILFTGPGCSPCTIVNGSLTTKNATLLIGPITLTSAGNYTVTVQNGPSGTQSNGLPLTILSPVPVVTSISPTSMPADGGQHQLTINGSNFASGNWVQVEYTGSNGWIDALHNPPNVTSPSQMTINIGTGTTSDKIYVRVCESKSQETASTCSSGTQYITVN
jgi:hypothetical protein